MSGRRCRTERPGRPASLTCRVCGFPGSRRGRRCRRAREQGPAGRGAGRPPFAPRQRSPRRPAAEQRGRKQLRSNRFQLLQTKPPGHPVGRGPRGGGAGPDVTPGTFLANGRPHARGGPARSWKGSALPGDLGGAFPESPSLPLFPVAADGDTEETPVGVVDVYLSSRSPFRTIKC